MKVTTPAGDELVYDDVSAIGVGHAKKHLTLVPSAGDLFEVNESGWRRFEAEQRDADPEVGE